MVGLIKAFYSNPVCSSCGNCCGICDYLVDVETNGLPSGCSIALIFDDFRINDYTPEMICFYFNICQEFPLFLDNCCELITDSENLSQIIELCGSVDLKFSDGSSLNSRVIAKPGLIKKPVLRAPV